MKRLTLAALVALSVSTVAAKEDPRLAIAKSAFVIAADPLRDDTPVAACLANRLATLTPLTTVEDRAAADVVLIVAAHLPGETMRVIAGGVGIGNVRIRAETPNGVLLWSASASRQQAIDLPCGLADAIADKLRQAMQKARDKK